MTILNTFHKSNKYVLCYFDVLGTSNKIQNNINEAIDELWMIFHNLEKQIYEIDSKCIVKAFTDNFLIAREIEDGDIKAVVEDVLSLTSRVISNLLLANQTLIRGAVVLDDMFILDNIIVGKALLKAYELEQNVCIYPRVIIDDSVTKYFDKITEYRNLKHQFFKDYDGIVCFNYLLYYDQKHINTIYNKAIHLLKQKENHCILKEDSKIQIKYSWVVKYFEEYKSNNLLY